MKKVIAILSIAAVVFTACGANKFKCDFCGEEKTGTPNKFELLGQEYKICDSCQKELDNTVEGVWNSVEDVVNSLFGD